LGFETYSQKKTEQINSYILNSLNRCRESVSARFSPLVEAMAYSVEGPGKRLRPLMVLASAEYLGVEENRVLPAACALEYIHTYSLIHDDLPAMDDDDERRGKPSSHKKFGEALAILAGDALLTEAFGQMQRLVEENHFKPAQVLDAVNLLARKAGVGGMVGGQLLDVTTDYTSLNIPELEFIHIHKTGALIKAAILLPPILSGANKTTVEKLRKFGETLGLAYQISDDLLDASESLRYARLPRKNPKPSYTQVMGASEVRSRLNGLIENAIDSIKKTGPAAQPLIHIAEFIRTRKN